MSNQFSIELWKERAKQKVASVSNWLNLNRATPIVTYSTVAMVSIWPIVEAVTLAAKAGVPIGADAYVAAVGLTSAVGGNLIAGMLQRWYDKAAAGEPPDEQEIVTMVSTRAAEDDAFRGELDHIIDEFEIFPEVQAHLTQEQQADFAAQIQAEMEQLGNWEKFAETITNSQIAQGKRAQAVGDGGVATQGDVVAPIVTGSNVTINWNAPDAQQSPAPMAHDSPPDADEPDKLYEKMIEWLSVSDVRTICFNMGLNYNFLTGANHPEVVQDLIRSCRQHKKIKELVEQCETLNARRNWQK